MKLLLGNSVNVLTGTEMDFQSPTSIEFEEALERSRPALERFSEPRVTEGFFRPSLEEFCPGEPLEWDESFEPAGAGALADWPL